MGSQIFLTRLPDGPKSAALPGDLAFTAVSRKRRAGPSKRDGDCTLECAGSEPGRCILRGFGSEAGRCILRGFEARAGRATQERRWSARSTVFPLWEKCAVRGGSAYLSLNIFHGFHFVSPLLIFEDQRVRKVTCSLPLGVAGPNVDSGLA